VRPLIVPSHVQENVGFTDAPVFNGIGISSAGQKIGSERAYNPGMKNYLLIVSTAFLLFSTVAGADPGVDPFAGFTRGWRDSPVWYDGQAECAEYDATRTIYGKERRYTARIFTNKEKASAETFTKSGDDTGRSVFKHHIREDIPTEKYTYHYSTMTYVGTDDLKSLKLDMGSQEDCGATYKQYVNHAGVLRWNQHSYFPDEGERSGEVVPDKRFAFQDALTLILRGYPFDDPPKTLELQMLRDQTDTHLTLPEELSGGVSVVRYVGEETLALPIGEVEAHHLVLRLAPDWEEHYWFASDPGKLHVLVQYRGSRGVEYKLRKLDRCAYWR
jgi:hypothetical protein